MTHEPLAPFDGDLDELIAYARQLLAHKLVPLKQEAFRDLVAVAEQHQRLLASRRWSAMPPQVVPTRSEDALDQLLADAEIVSLRGGPDRIAFLKEQP